MVEIICVKSVKADCLGLKAESFFEMQDCIICGHICEIWPGTCADQSIKGFPSSNRCHCVNKTGVTNAWIAVQMYPQHKRSRALKSCLCWPIITFLICCAITDSFICCHRFFHQPTLLLMWNLGFDRYKCLNRFIWGSSCLSRNFSQI